MPQSLQSGAPTWPQKGVGAGVRSLQVDVVWRSMGDPRCPSSRLAAAGPTLIEAVSYRLEDHTTRR